MHLAVLDARSLGIWAIIRRRNRYWEAFVCVVIFLTESTLPMEFSGSSLLNQGIVY